MAIYRSKISKNFTVVPNELIDEPKLSGLSKWVLIYLISKPDNWNANPKDIANSCSNGIAAIRSSLKELREAGYIVYSGQERGKDGKLGRPIYDVYDTPQSPRTDSPHAVSPYTGNRTLINTDSNNTDINKISSKEDTEVPAEGLVKTSKRSYGNQEINEILDYFEQRLGFKPDGSEKENRQYANLLIRKLKSQGGSDQEAVSAIQALVDAGMTDTFHSRNLTSIKYLYYNAGKILLSNRKSGVKIANIS